MRRVRLLVVLVALGLLAAACSRDRSPSPAGSSPAPSGGDTISDTSASAPAMDVRAVADSIVDALAREDWETLVSFVHPERGVRFSPYTYVDTAEHVVLHRQELVDAVRDSAVFEWGTYDGSGRPIRGTVSDYHEEFLYDKNFADGQRGEPGEVLRSGNTRNNIDDVYEEDASTFVSYHVPGTDEYEGMDWASVRVVLVREGDRWLLVGLVHDQWTI